MKKILLFLLVLTMLFVAACSIPSPNDVSDGEETEESDDSALAGNAKAMPKKLLQQACQGKADGYELQRCPTSNMKQQFCLRGVVQTRNCVQAPDRDQDGVNDVRDNCPGVANPQQRDVDRDGRGNHCDEDTVVVQDCLRITSEDSGKRFVLENDLNVDSGSSSTTCISFHVFNQDNFDFIEHGNGFREVNESIQNVIIDCQGHSITAQSNYVTGVGHSGVPVRLRNVVINHCKFVNLEHGVEYITQYNEDLNQRRTSFTTSHRDIIVMDSVFENSDARFGNVYGGGVNGLGIHNISAIGQTGFYLTWVNGLMDGVNAPDGSLTLDNSHMTVRGSLFCGELIRCDSISRVGGNENTFDAGSNGSNQCTWALDPTTHSACPQQ